MRSPPTFVRFNKTTDFFTKFLCVFRAGDICGGWVQQGRFVVLPFPLFCSGVPRYPDAGKGSTKSVIVTPPFVCPTR